MERLISENPENFVIIKITHEGNSHYRVFGSWRGGYLDGDRWKMNSGISEIDEDDENYFFIGYSGSVYKCKKNRYGIATSYCEGVLNNMIKSLNDVSGSVEILPENTTFNELFKK